MPTPSAAPEAAGDAGPADRFRAVWLRLAGAAPAADRRLGVAVSGGADSLALLLLADAAFPGCIAAATVDHGLRAGAAEEARAVAATCAGLGVPHAILGPGHETALGRGSVQAQARRLRYGLLGRWAAAARLGWIATAHHLDDQAETFLMRAARGSGAAGLAGVRASATIAGVPVPVIRPLLGWRRTELTGIVAAAGIAAAADPSNRDPAYDRTAFRALLAAAPRLRPEGLARAAANLAEAEEALAWAATAIAGDRLGVDDDGVRLIDPAGLPGEIRRRLVIAALAQAGARAPRGDDVERLIGRLAAGTSATLGGVLARPGGDWRFAPEPRRRGS